MTLTAGALSAPSIQANQATVVSTAASGGTGPYTQQLYMSQVTGFSPGPSNEVDGATALSNIVSGLIPGTPYFFKMVYTDTGHSNDTITSAELALVTAPPTQSQNAFQQSPILGMIDLPYNPNTVAVQVDVSQDTPMYAGQAVKCVDSAGGVPKVVACSADTDEVMGFINYDIKSRSFSAGDMAQISCAGNVVWLYATTAIARLGRVTLDLTTRGGVAAAASPNRIVGYAFDKATAPGDLIRVHVLTPSFTVAS